MRALPSLSIVTPSFNQAQFIEETITSVINHGYPSLEYIIIDGGSTDSTQSIIKRHENSIDYWVSEPDKGQAEAINKGLKRASGEFIAWINSDDFYLPGALLEAGNALLRNPDAGMVYADGILVDREGRLLDWHRYGTYSALELLQFKVILQPTVVMRRAALEKVGYLDESFQLVLDHDLWIRIASEFPIIHNENFWAAERTYPQAKTRALAADFVEESRLLIEKAGKTGKTASLIEDHYSIIMSSLNVFAGRRLIDAGEYRTAFRRFLKAVTIHPGPVFRYWYKVLQALIGACGMERLFLKYRQLRRRLKFNGMLVTIDGVMDADVDEPI